ncbi:MAG: pyrroline-5-carboxylate reductase [Nitrospinae bacterium]|nr:pyrroline-5-carboxylate reductase [Nitrospinota bacterium]
MIGNRKIAFIGAGFMGGAIIRGLVRAKSVKGESLMAADPREGALKELARETGIKVTTDNAEAVSFADIVVLATKPQVLKSVVEPLGRKIGKKKLVISIAAGVRADSLLSWIGSGARVVRAMPNMPATVGEGATAICPAGAADAMDIASARLLFDCVGETVLVDEKMMDAVTGLSGSGPAFVFMFLEAMIDAGVRCGLPRDAARALAAQTLYGAAKMAKTGGEHPAALKDRVTSPGGTTIAGLAVLEDEGFRGAVIRAVEEAAGRSRELGS